MRLLAASICLLTTALPAPALTIAVTPEPGTLTMLALGAAAGGFLLWRKNRNAKR
jgi:hypothetical protein